LKDTDAWWIRATQGHSIADVDDDRLLRQLQRNDPNLPEFIVHGTKRACLDGHSGIRQRGLLAGGHAGQSHRAHVHFNTQIEGVTSGMRDDSEVAVWVNLHRAILDMHFYISSNGVILSRGLQGVIPKEYFHKVIDLRSNRELRF